MKNFTDFLLGSFLLCSFLGHSQVRFDFEYFGDYPVIINNDTLKNPWAGGLYQGQFIQFDLDADGVDDLLIFEKYGNRLIPFLKTTQGSASFWKYTPELTQNFPPVKYFVQLVDYNCDGKKDLFTQNDAGVLVYTNTSVGSNLSFTAALSGNLQTRYLGQSFINNLFIPNSDNPVIADVNGDGNIDILTFSVEGVAVGMHKGMQNCGLQFEEVDDCWGNFTEGIFDGTISLNTCSTSNKRRLSPADFPNFSQQQLDSITKTQHAGSAMLTLDLNDDGLPDLLIADIDQKNITGLTNGGILDSAHMIIKDSLFPLYDKSVNLNIFPASFYTDIDFDGIKDLIVTPNLNGHNNTKNVWYYKNQGGNTLPDFEFQDSTSWQAQMIELGERSYPVLHDLDGDGLKDLIISSYGIYEGPGQYDARLYFFKNTGTVAEPIFELVNSNLANIPQYQIGSLPAPTFGDLTGNGLPDMIIGDQSGQLHYFTNTGTSTNPQFVLSTANLGNIQVPGGFATPFLYDVSGDGALDLLVGNTIGTIFYYERTSSGQLQFNLVNDRFGGIKVSGNLGIGATNPVVVEQNGVPSLLVGSFDRGVLHYDSLQYIANKPASISGTVGTGNDVSPNFEVTPFGASKRSGRNQYLYSASDLQASGLEYGVFAAISFEIVANTPSFTYQNNLRIAMKHTSASSVTNFDDNDWTTVLNERVALNAGWNKFTLPNEFLWNGVDNILIEICFERNIAGPDLHVLGEQKSYTATGFGDITNFNTLLAKGCEMPYKGNTTFLPNIQVDIIPGLREVDRFLQDGIYNYVAAAELTDDTYPEIILGNGSGGVQFFRGIEFDNTVSLQEPLDQNRLLRVYPNPTNNRLTIALDIPEVQRGKIELYDLNGRLALQSEWLQNQPEISIQHLPAGMYVLHFIANENLYFTKVVKQ